MAGSFFATGYIRLLYQWVRANHVEAEGLLDSTSVTEADLMRADFQMPFVAQMHLCENAIDLCDPGLGMRVGHQLQLASHGTLGNAMQSASTLVQALSTFIEFIDTRASFFDLSLDPGTVERDARVDICIESDELSEKLVPFFTEAILFSLIHCLAYYCGRRDCVRSLALAYAAPSYEAKYAEVFGGDIHFDATKSALIFDRSLLQLPSPEADDVLFAASVQRCRELVERQQGPDIASSVETFFLENPGRLWSVDELAPLFSVSPRTLLRKLRQADVTYQSLRDGVLQQQALAMLNSMSVEATALALGFADASSFRRSFKRWFGYPPSQK